LALFDKTPMNRSATIAPPGMHFTSNKPLVETTSEDYLKLIKVIYTGSETAISSISIAPDETLIYCLYSNRHLSSFQLDLTCIFVIVV
jgi:hypothetical protein